LAENTAHPAHHFADLTQQHETAQIGMWVFLLTEIMLFGGLFTAYAMYRYAHPAGFVAASQHSAVILGTLNTAILLTSSLTMALAVHAAKAGERRPLSWCLAATFLLGATFLAIKGFEYTQHFHEHLFPGAGFQFEGPDASGAELFFFLYFVMTGTHAVHMIVGLALVGGLAILARRGRYTTGHPTPVEIAGLYWHFVDVIWIFLFPLFYLVGIK
jgi:cytochrome c oxidase subunit 3